MTPTTSEHKKKHCKTSTNLFMNLPPDLVKQILEVLPLRDAARTSILSKSWRCKWLSLRHIRLDLKFSQAFHKRENTATLDFPRVYSDAVNKILLRHRGPIHKFIFYVPPDLPKAIDIDCWIEFVCRNGVKVLNLVDKRLLYPKLPSCIFSCVSLTHLTLNCGPLSSPTTFRGFPCLISLLLCTCEDDNQKLESLIHNCPQLEKLVLLLTKAINFLTIRASKLQDLDLHAKVYNLGLEDTTRIRTLKLDTRGGNLQSSLPDATFFRLSNFQVDLENNVSMSDVFSKGCGLKTPKLLAKGLDKLHTLTLAMPLSCQYTISFICCAFERSSNLSRLHIEATRCGNCGDKLLEFDETCNLVPLKYVELLSFSGVSSELFVVKFLLARSPTLPLMTIKLDKSVTKPEEKFNLATKVMMFRRASTNAEVAMKA